MAPVRRFVPLAPPSASHLTPERSQGNGRGAGRLSDQTSSMTSRGAAGRLAARSAHQELDRAGEAASVELNALFARGPRRDAPDAADRP